MKDLTEGNIYKNFILFAIPLILAGLLSQAYAIIDSMIAGRYLGEAGLAAVGATSAFTALISSIFWGYGMGASIHTAMLFGAKSYRELKTMLYSNGALYIGAGIAISILAILFRLPILDFLKVDAAVRADAEIYFVIYVAGLSLITLNAFGVYTTNALGMSDYPLWMSVLSTVLNIGGNILSVTVLKMGVVGIALSSVFSALVVNICYFIKLRSCFMELGCADFKVKIRLKYTKETLGYGIPSTLQQICMYVASLLVSPIVNGIGASATAAYSIALQIYNINAGIYQNSSKTVTNYTAQCVGAGKKDALSRGVRVGLMQGVLFLTPALVLSAVFAPALCRAFFSGTYTGDALRLSVLFVRFYLPFAMFNMINNLFHSFFRGVKATGLLLFFTALGAVTRIAASLILAKIYGMHGVYAAWVLSWIVEAVWVVIVYFAKYGRKQEV